MHQSYAQIPRRQVKLMDLKDTFQFVAPRVREAAVRTAAQLNHLGIRYALAGGWQSERMGTFEPLPTSFFWSEKKHSVIRDYWWPSKPASRLK